MTTVADDTIIQGVERAIQVAIDRGHSRLTPSGMFGQHRQFTAEEFHDFVEFAAGELGVQGDLLEQVAEMPDAFDVEFDRWTFVSDCPGYPELKLEAMRVCHNCHPLPNCKVDFAIRRT
jgi:hypothetical protein